MSGPAATVERVWSAYVVAVLVISCTCGDAERAWTQWASHAALHLTFLIGALWSARRSRRLGHERARWSRVALALVGLPLAFSAMCWLLPYVHPEPYEYDWLAWDHWLLGDHAAVVTDQWLGPLGNELLQCIYAAFYLVPVVAALGVLQHRGAAAFDRAVAIFTGGFLLSYLGYLLVPTLAPKVVLVFEHELHGLWLFAPVRAWIDGAEANPWDCFPSGHTMLTLVSLMVTWRWHRRLFWWLLVPCLLLVASTVLLRYHWVIDVLAGALLVWPTVRGIEFLLDRDGWPGADAPALTSA